MEKHKDRVHLFYYLRDPHRRPVVTICLIEDGEGVVARGVAICSELDQPCRKTGRGIASQRALAAITDYRDRLAIATPRAKGILKECAAPRAVFKSKSFVADKPQLLSAFERKLLAKAKAAKEATA